MKMNVMKKTKVWLTTGALAVMSLCLTMGFGAMGTLSAKAEETVDISMEYGGSFRYEGGTLGLGFTTQIKKADYAALDEKYDVKTGTLFVREKDATDANVTLADDTFTFKYFTENNVSFTYKDVKNSGWKEETGDYYKFRGSIVNMKQLNVEKEYCARGYVAYKEEGTEDTDTAWTYLYTSYSKDAHCRSIETIAMSAMADVKDSSEGEYTNLVEETGKYSRFDTATREKIGAYAARENEKTIFAADKGSIQYLYWANGNKAKEYTQYSATTDTSAIVKENADLTGLTLNGYEGSAIEINNFARNNQTYVKLPTRYAQDNADAYSKIGVWFAMFKKDDATWDKKVYLNANTSYLADGNIITMGNNYAYNTFYYVEFALPTADSECWSSGYLRLWDMWSDATTLEGGDEIFKNDYKLYLGSITYMTAQEIADRDNDKLSAILNGVTVENYTQYSLTDRNDGTDRVFLENTALAGGYNGSAVQFRPGTNKIMTIAFPAGLQYLTNQENTDGLYFTVWVAVKTNVADSEMAGTIKFANAAGTLFDKNIAYAYNNDNFALNNNVQWDETATVGYAKDTWYQLYIPLANVMENNIDGTIDMFKIDNAGYAAADQDNFRLLVGNIGIATQAELDALKPTTPEPEVPNLLNGLTAENYTQYNLTDRNEGENRVFLENTELAGGYNGPAVQFTMGSNKFMTIAFPAGLENLTDADSAEGLYFTVWVAIKTNVADSTMAGQVKFANGVGTLFDKTTVYAHNNATFTTNNNILWNEAATTGFAKDTWYQLYIPLANVVANNTEGTMNMFKIDSDGYSSADQTNFKLLIGNIGVATQVELDNLKNA